MKKLNENVRAIRQLKGLTQEQAGQWLGTTKANFNRIEKGHVDVSPSKLAKLAELFQMSQEEIENFRSEKDQAVAEKDQVVAKIEQLKRHIAALERYINQTEDLLIESETFFRYFNRVLLQVFPGDGENAVSLTQLNQAWAKLVSYSGANTTDAEAQYEAHRRESPLAVAKQRDLDAAVMIMQQLFSFHAKGKIPLGE